MQFDVDINSKLSDIFLALREIILSFCEIKEKKNAKQTSYSDRYGVVVMLRGRDDEFIASFGQGAKLQEKYPCLRGNGKIVRQLSFKSLDDINKKLLKEIIRESMILNMEYYELKKLRKKI
jgi:uncharacterized protein YdeI (YjbR/CyaY-like superfamily)